MHYSQRLRFVFIATVTITACTQINETDYRTAYYESEGIALPLHIFSPTDLSKEKSYPTIIFFHGGGWQTGTPKQFHPQCAILSKLGFQCVSVGYRVSNIYQSTPLQSANDALSAIYFLYSHANSLNINVKQIFLAGGSAGGHLAALSAIRLQQSDAKINIAGLILLNPILNLAPGNPDHHLVTNHWQQLSPFHQMKQEIPPTLILVGDQDKESPLNLLKAFCHKAISLGGQCRINVAENQKHGFFNYHISRFQFYRSLFIIYRFLNNVM